MENSEHQSITYQNYIDEHINNVKKAFEMYGNKLCMALGLNLFQLSSLIEKHDESKMDNEEFFCYAQYFYPIKGEEKSKELFDVGWLLHQNRNAHHPEFWILRDDKGTKILDMPNIYIAEMLLDWAAMGFKFGNTAYSYYQSNGGKNKPFSDNTRKTVESIIHLFK